MESDLSVLTILFISTFTRSFLGFGDSLIAMPLLAMLVGITTATPLVALAAITISVLILSRAWKRVDIKAAWRLILSALIGIPIGLFFLKTAPESIVKSILGVVLIGFGIYNLTTPKLSPVQGNWATYTFGLLSGILGGAYNANGPPAVIYGVLKQWEPDRFRATLQGFLLPTGLMIVIGHGLAGLWTPRVLNLYLWALPIIITAVITGGILNKKVSGDHFKRIIYLLLILLGLSLISTSL